MQTDSVIRRHLRRIPMLAAAVGSLLAASTLSSVIPAEASPGDEIVFVRYFPLGLVIEDIYTTGFSSASATQLTSSPTISDNSPVWSPDGTTIAFTSNGSLAVMNADGTGYFTLPGSTLGGSPAWSPDGQSLAYTLGWGNNKEIHVYSLGGGGSVQLTSNAKDDGDPAWSPDGSKIVFSRNDPSASGPEFDLWVMRADGSNQTQLTKAHGWEVHPDWSPDGQTIVYTHGKTGAANQLWTVGATGSAGPQQITRGTSSFMPAWSPKGTHIVFARGKDEEAAPAHIWVIELRSGSERQVTSGNAKDYFPDWR